MKLSGFIFGGICGMLAAAYFSKKRPEVVSWASSKAGNMMSGAKGMMVDSALNRKFGRAGNESGTTSGASTESNKKSWETIENLINSDPEVKRQTSEIISGSERNTSH